MKMNQRARSMKLWISLSIRRTVFIGFAFGCLHCEEDAFTKTSLDLCRTLNCADGVDVNACKDDLVDRVDAAAEVSDTCETRYRAMIVCANNIIGCSETANWESYRGTGLDVEYECKAETEAFLDACGELWFPDKRMK